MEAAGLPIGAVSNEYLDSVLASVKEKIKLLKDVPAWTGYFFQDDFPFDEEAVNKTLRAPGAGERLEQLAARLETLPPESWDHDGLEGVFKGLATEGGRQDGVVHPPGARGRQRAGGRTELVPSAGYSGPGESGDPLRAASKR